MTRMRVVDGSVRLVARSLALSATITLLAGVTVVFAASETRDSGSFAEKMKKWQEEMSEKFRDSYKSLRGEKSEKSAATASVDLREQDESYTVRLNLPDRDLDKVEVTLEGDELHIVAPAEGKASRYEQTVQLSGASSEAKLQIERKQKDDLIVITVPKTRGLAQASPEPTVPDPSLLPLQDWDRDVLARMERIRREMDRIFDESFKGFRLLPEYKGMFDQPRFGSSVDLQEQGDNYVVRAYLPERDMKHVDVAVDGQTLKIEAKAEETEKKQEKGAIIAHKAHYAQMLTLPGPVKVDKMTVERKEGMLVVTLPKVAAK
jgi:HSP20 family molecular chaperone IbpA